MEISPLTKGKRSTILLKALPLPLIGVPLWFILTSLQQRVFALHSDTLDATYLFVQISAVYAGMIYVAAVGTMLILSSPKIRLRDLGFVTARADLWDVLLFIFSFIFLLLFEGLWQLACSALHLNLLNRDGLITTYTNMPSAEVVMALVITLVAPLGEETLFRGFVFRRLDEGLARFLTDRFSQLVASRVALIVAVGISASAFAALHPDIYAFPIYFVTGAVLALWVKYKRTVWPAFLLHMTWNSLFVVRLIMP